MIDRWTLAAIALMAVATYLTRIGGYLLLDGRELSPRIMTMLDTVPGCVLVAVIAPAFVSGRPSNLIALALTMFAAMRLTLLPTVLVAIGSTALLRATLG